MDWRLMLVLLFLGCRMVSTRPDIPPGQDTCDCTTETLSDNPFGQGTCDCTTETPSDNPPGQGTCDCTTETPSDNPPGQGTLSDNPPRQDTFVCTTETSSDNPPGQDTCGCTTKTLPHPRIVLLGPTGVGKSTFGNMLLGITEDNGKEGLCSHDGQKPYKFGVGHRSESHTIVTSWVVGHYLGNSSNPRIAIIDSPGTGDSEGRDCDHGIALAQGIKEIGSIDAFLLLFKGTNPRFSQSMQEQIQLYTNIFGADLFENVVTEFTYWSHDKKSVRKRKKTRDGLNEDIQHQTWNDEYTHRLGVPREINTVFIDPVYEEEYAEEREVQKFKEYTDKLWNLITNEFTEFKCDKRCKAPSGFFSGQPWLFAENILQNKRLEDHTATTWQIWFAGCDGMGTKSYKIYHKTTKGTVSEIYDYVIHDNDKESVDDSNLLKGMNVTDEPAEKFKTIRVTIDVVEDLHFGEYYVENDKGRSQISKLNKIIDGEWGDWGHFSECSKTCVKGDEQPGSMEQVRECKPPQNGGLECKGPDKQTRACAHRHGDVLDKFRQCPVDATWSSWPSGWGQCSGNCIKEKGFVPQQTRSRVCMPERFGGRTCNLLEEETKKEDLPTYFAKQNCTYLPECPKPASLGPWSEWSSCASTCYPEGGIVPQSTRKRTCKKATLSTNDELNVDIMTCQALGEITAYKNCEISACPVNAEWQDWSEWSPCSTSCGKGSKHRSRSYFPGRNGAKPKPTGDQKEKKDCNIEVKCPVAATWTWGSWSSCSINCYIPDGDRGMRSRKRVCTEGSPRHSTLSCSHPPAPGFVDTQEHCPGLPKCIQRSSQTSADWKWNDDGSGAHSDFSCWNPSGDHMVASKPLSGYYYYDKVYGYTFSGYGMDYPATYSLIWKDSGSGAHHDGSFWRPICNSNYVALGHYCQYGHSKPSIYAMKCVLKDLTKKCEANYVWKDSGSGADADVSVFKTEDPYVEGMVAVSYHTTDIQQAYCLK